MVYGTDFNGDLVTLAAVDHPLLASSPGEAITIPLSTVPVRQLVFTIFGTPRLASSSLENMAVANAVHYIGGIRLLSQRTISCPAADGFEATPVETTARLSVYNASSKGFVQRFCAAVSDPADPMNTRGEWGPTDSTHLVRRVPQYPGAFVEFMYVLSGLSWSEAYEMAGDLRAVMDSVVRKHNLPVQAITVFRVSDTSSLKTAKVLFSIQLKTKLAQAHAVASFINGGDSYVSRELVDLFGSKYPTLTDFRLSNFPLVIQSRMPTWLRVLIWIGVVLCVGAATVLVIKYRVALWRMIDDVVNGYRERRRRDVCDEMGIPYNMTYLPKKSEANGEAMSFETPYGEIHLVPPVVRPKDQDYDGYIQAVSM